ncbi:MAG: hypothetical protein JNK14_19360 [Chitinophagaceae bacterium]|nr:hypothetical protein [Chitinophagaceae bacterium]
MYEHKRQPLASRKIYYKRLGKNLVIAFLVIIVCLIIGTVGYYMTRDKQYLPAITWLDAFHNASMILSGMGPVMTINTDSGKWFSSFYALFSGIVFITNIGLILAPALHRFFHKLHIEEK